jgi:hypothetical protein
MRTRECIQVCTDIDSLHNISISRVRKSFLFSPTDALYICLHKQMYSASVGENKKDFDDIKIHSTTMKKKSQLLEFPHILKNYENTVHDNKIKTN